MISVWKRMNGCCYCLGLRAGTLTILWLAFIIFGLHTVHTIFIHKTLFVFPRIMISAITIFLGFVPAGLGLYGVYMRKAKYLIPYIIIAIVHVTFTLIVALILTFILIVSPGALDDKDMHFSTPESSPRGAVMFVIGFDFVALVVSAFYWYIINVVRSYYLLLFEAQEEPRPSGSSAASAPRKK